jgi:hypothetical protein
MPDPIRFNLATLGQLQQPANPGIGWVGPERPAESWADIAADPLSALFDVGRGAVTGDAPAGMNLQGLGALIAAAMPVAGGAKALRAATKAAKISELADEAAQAGIKAYHGSPHDFDRFSMSKIGTGEGAQAYGHGLYFAENPAVAGGYRDTLSPGRGGGPEDVAARTLKAVDGDRDKAIAEIQKRIDLALQLDKRAPVENIQKAKDLLQRGENVSGRMYEVQIHASPDHFLDWDKPLSEQSEHVRQAVGNIPDAPLVQKYVANNQRSYANPSGENLHDILEMSGRSRREIGEQLQQAGIPGIRYLDAGSRMPPDVEFLKKQVANIEERAPLARASSDPEALQRHAASLEQAKNELAAAMAKGQTRNYVIFDENLVSILKKYGVALPVIEGLREKAQKGGGVVPSSDVHSLVQ